MQTFEEFPDEPELGKQYALSPNAALQEQMEKFKQWRTRILNINRTTKRVEPITVEVWPCVWTDCSKLCMYLLSVQGDCKTMLRFLGFVKHKFQDIEPLSFEVFGTDDARKLVDSFANFLVDERGNGYGTVSNYLNR